MEQLGYSESDFMVEESGECIGIHAFLFIYILFKLLYAVVLESCSFQSIK